MGWGSHSERRPGPAAHPHRQSRPTSVFQIVWSTPSVGVSRKQQSRHQTGVPSLIPLSLRSSPTPPPQDSWANCCVPGARRWYLQACPLAGPLFLLIPGQMLLASKGAHTEKCWAVHSVGAGGRGQGLGPSWKTQPVTSCGFAKPRPPLLPRAQRGAGASRLQVRAALRPISGVGAGGGAVVVAVARSPGWKPSGPHSCSPLPPSASSPAAHQGGRFVLAAPGHDVGGPLPRGVSSAPLGVAQSWCDRLSRSRGCGQKAFITTWIQTPRCVDGRDHHDAGDRLPLPAKLLRASPRRKLGNRLTKRVIWGVLYKPKEMYTSIGKYKIQKRRVDLVFCVR